MNTEEEKKKKLAEDIAYTVNHAVACGTLDVIGMAPLASHLAEKYTWLKPILHHSAPDAPPHTHPWWEWLFGELSGDVIAVAPTIAVQKYAPGVMDDLQAALEPVVGWAYRNGAERSAKKWAMENRLDFRDPRVKERADELYQHEVEHLPHAVLWTALALPSTILTMRGVDRIAHKFGHHHDCHHHHNHFLEDMGYAAIGKAVSGSILLGGRAVAPETARSWDDWASDTVYYPITKGLGALFGVDEEAIDAVQEKRDALLNKTAEDMATPKAPPNKTAMPPIDAKLNDPSAHIVAPTQAEKLMVEQARQKV